MMNLPYAVLEDKSFLTTLFKQKHDIQAKRLLSDASMYNIIFKDEL